MYHRSQSSGGEGRGRWKERENREMGERDEVEKKNECLGSVVVRNLEVGHGDLEGEEQGTWVIWHIVKV